MSLPHASASPPHASASPPHAPAQPAPTLIPYAPPFNYDVHVWFFHVEAMPLLDFPAISAAQASDSHLNDLLTGDTGLRLEFIPAPDGVNIL
ncbi:hypothetical protein Pcinc_004999 [Petrolisthes cinctipes]|uniref:Uncharacterized protein n=1 Tax=Petrolisthes cinctipes TaxID=88211 RepID=A0AAE1KZJ6_PETCI|nr:hypothetical protein Pcinc_004999 [Petrolisthes cinctipes]